MKNVKSIIVLGGGSAGWMSIDVQEEEQNNECSFFSNN